MDPLLRRVAARALASAPAAASGVRLRQKGTLRLRPGGRWRRFEATQEIWSGTARFQWSARIALAPCVGLRVLDGFEGGRGRLDVRLLRWLRVASASGPEIDSGELLRYLAELPWCPHAYHGNPGLVFDAEGATHLAVSTALDGTAARVRLTVDANGDVVEAFAAARPRLVGRAFVSSPWQGRFSDHRTMAGIRVPTRATVTWLLDDGPFECFRAEVVDLALVP
jgi:hypothetical protein